MAFITLVSEILTSATILLAFLGAMGGSNLVKGMTTGLGFLNAG